MNDTGTNPTEAAPRAGDFQSPSAAPVKPDGDCKSPALEPLFVSLDDHLAGFKVIEVETRAGSVEQVRLTAPTRRATRARLNAIRDAEAFPWEVVALCLPECLAELGERYLDLLTPDAAALVEVTAFALTFGAGTQKKIEQATLAKLMASANSAPSNGSSPAAGPSEKSSAGAGPSSSSAPRLPKNPS